MSNETTAVEVIAQDFIKKINEISTSVKPENESSSEGSQNLEDNDLADNGNHSNDYRNEIKTYLDTFPEKKITGLLKRLVADVEFYDKDEKINIFYYLIISIIKKFNLPGELIISNLDDQKVVIEYALNLLMIIENYTQTLKVFFKYVYEHNNKFKDLLKNKSIIMEDYVVQYLIGKNYDDEAIYIAMISKFLSEASNNDFNDFIALLKETEPKDKDQEIPKVYINQYFVEDIFTNFEEYFNFQKTIIYIGKENRYLFQNIISNYDKEIKRLIRGV